MDEVFCVPNETTGCGFGICNELGTGCACDPGYTFDYTQMMFPNCFLSQSVLVGLLSVFGAISLLAVVASVWVLKSRKRKGIPLQLCYLALATGVLGCGYALCLGLEGRPAVGTAIFYGLLCWTGAGLSPAVLIWMFTSPFFLHFGAEMHVTKRKILRGMCTLPGLFFGECVCYFC
jgi:ABC-type branched-subunit amino acid transport system permease subunit